MFDINLGRGAATSRSNSIEELLRPLLVDGELFEIGFGTIAFTNMRLVLVDITGKKDEKREFHSVPYSKISQFCIRGDWIFRSHRELRIWVGSDPDPIERGFYNDEDIFLVQRILGKYILTQ